MSDAGYLIDDALYERVINTLADHEGLPAVRLAMHIGEDGAKIKRVLREAESRGHVVRQGRAWYLG